MFFISPAGFMEILAKWFGVLMGGVVDTPFLFDSAVCEHKHHTRFSNFSHRCSFLAMLHPRMRKHRQKSAAKL